MKEVSDLIQTLEPSSTDGIPLHKHIEEGIDLVKALQGAYHKDITFTKSCLTLMPILLLALGID